MVYIESYNPEPEVILGIHPVISGKAHIIKSNLGKYTQILPYVECIESTLGDYSYVMERSSIAYSIVGKFVNIASDVRINPGNHPMDWACQHHIMYRKKQYGIAKENDGVFFANRKAQVVTIGHDVWVGHGATILAGVSIGNGAIIGAGSVVTHDVEPYTIVAGIPEKEIRTRFSSRVKEGIEKSAWWDWDHEILKARIDDFRDVNRFVTLYGDA